MHVNLVIRAYWIVRNAVLEQVVKNVCLDTLWTWISVSHAVNIVKTAYNVDKEEYVQNANKDIFLTMVYVNNVRVIYITVCNVHPLQIV